MGKADDGGGIGDRQFPAGFLRRFDLFPRTALRFPMSVRNAASKEIYFAHADFPMPIPLSTATMLRAAFQPSRVIACSQCRGELNCPPTNTTSKLDIVAQGPRYPYTNSCKTYREFAPSRSNLRRRH